MAGPPDNRKVSYCNVNKNDTVYHLSDNLLSFDFTQDCPDDQSGSFLVDNEIGMETCTWLEANRIEYEYLCAFTDVATMCPATCGFCPAAPSTLETKSLQTDMNGTVQWFGGMFNVEVKNNVTVTSVSFHTASIGSVPVNVYTKKGTYDMASRSDHKASDWTLISNTTVQARGLSKATQIPVTDFVEVYLHEGDIQAFYIDTGSTKNVILSGKKGHGRLQLHDTWFENADLSILVGSAVTGWFGGSYPLYAWNGVIHYYVDHECTDGSATVAVDNVGDVSCDWLSRNQARFGFLCERIQIATACPQTCTFCDSTKY